MPLLKQQLNLCTVFVCGNLNEYTKNTACFEEKYTKSFKELNCDTIVTILVLGKSDQKSI